MKYFNFLLENEINFTRDESGHYVALVKVLNPQFFGEKEPKNEIKFEENKELFTPQKPRSTSQVITNRKTAPQSAKSIRPKSPVIANKNIKVEKNKTQNNFKLNQVE